jgi:uncharacterized protein (DUF2384 family)
MAKYVKLDSELIDDVPTQINESEILYLLHKKDINWNYVNAFKHLTDFNDDMISGWLNLSVKTFREYRKPNAVFKDNVKEHILLLIALFKHGIRVFGDSSAFEKWLTTGNFYFDHKTPESYLNTVTGIRFTDDRLTALEFGDNV